MKRTRSISLFLLSLFIAAGVISASAALEDRSQAQLRAIVLLSVANQHRNDAALAEYERLERRQAMRAAGEFIAKDELFRVVPAGTGNVKIQLEENGEQVSPVVYRKQVEGLELALSISTNPEDSRFRTKSEKWQKRQREREEIVDAIPNAFSFTFLGRENRQGRTLTKLLLEPRADFRPASTNAALLSNVRATVWLDEKSSQLVRAEAEIIRDVLFGGGILGKVNRGGRIVIEQAEVEPGVWLPTLYDYDLKGRRFLFPFQLRELTAAHSYRRIGPPAEALRTIRAELYRRPAAPRTAPVLPARLPEEEDLSY